MTINVFSEIGKLKKVMLHRPGKELLNLTPDVLHELLFDDIPGYYEVQKEHDEFAKIFEENGVEVVYLEDLMTQTLDGDIELRDKFTDQYLSEANLNHDFIVSVKRYLSEFDTKDFVEKTMAGITVKELESFDPDFEHDEDIYIIFPMPNLYFTRDSFATIGKGVSLHHMLSDTRNRETIYGQYIFNHHPEYRDTKLLYDRYSDYNIEGGDILVVEDLLLIGNSERTSTLAIQELASNIFADKDSKIKTILELSIDKKRAFMHLDTVFTQIDIDAFVVHPEILENMKVTAYTYENNEVRAKIHQEEFLDLLKIYMGLEDIKLFYCGGDDKLAAKREQWTDGSNLVAIEPGKVIAYKRNFITNKILKDAGYNVLELDASNLTMGRGGPRCMSMPLYREGLDEKN